MRYARTIGLGLVAGAGVAILAAAARALRSSSPATTPAPARHVDPQVAARHVWARPILRAAFNAKIGREPTLAELQYLHGVAFHETRYGRANFIGDIKNEKNWGAVQCLPSDPAEACTAQTEDSKASGKHYPARFKVYKSDELGAQGTVSNVVGKSRPLTAAVLASAHPTVFGASLAMRREHYYEGFCPHAKAQFGADAVDESFKSPDKNQATQACEREAVEGHAAAALWPIIQDVASSLGEGIAIPLGTFDDAQRAYRQANA